MNAQSLTHWIPAFSWLRAYNRRWLRNDVFAGITLAAYLLPAGLGDASLANLPPEAGLYGSFVVRGTRSSPLHRQSRCSLELR